MRGSRPEEDAVFVEIQSRGEIADERHPDEHELREGVADEAVNAVGSGRANLDGFEAVAIHQSYMSSDNHVSLRSLAIFFPEVESVRDILRDHTESRAGVEDRVGAGFFGRAENCAGDREQTPENSSGSCFARNRRPRHSYKVTDSSSSSGVNEYVV